MSDNWRLVGAVRKVEFKLLQLKPALGLLIASTREDAGATLILITWESRIRTTSESMWPRRMAIFRPSGDQSKRLQPQVVSITGSDAVNDRFSVASEANPTVRKCAFARFLHFQQLRGLGGIE